MARKTEDRAHQGLQALRKNGGGAQLGKQAGRNKEREKRRQDGLSKGRKTVFCAL